METSSDGDGRESPFRGTITPHTAASFANLYKCPQFFKYAIAEEPPRTGHDEEAFAHSFTSASIIDATHGERFEQAVIGHYREETPVEIVDEDVRKADARVSADRYDESGEFAVFKRWLDRLAAAGGIEGPLLLDQVSVRDGVGCWRFVGRADAIFLWQDGDEIRIRVGEMKSGHEKRASHWLQAGIYATIIESWLEAMPGIEATVDGTVITPETDLPNHPSELDPFNLRAVREDIRLLTREGGVLARIDDTPHEDVTYSLSSKCQSCDYQEVCYAHSVEEASPALLGLSRREQEAVAALGLDSIHDFAMLTDEIRTPDRRPDNHIDLGTRLDSEAHRIVHQELPEVVGGTDPTDLIEQSQILLDPLVESEFGSLDGPSAYAHDHDIAWRSASGYCGLPADDDLVRVAIHVERDQRYDRVPLLAAHIDAPDAEARRVCRTVDEIPHSPDAPVHEAIESETAAYDDAEAELVEGFAEDVLDAMQNAAMEAGMGDEAKIHFYFFAQAAEETLVDALDRREESKHSAILRELLDGRGPVEGEQEMRSIIKEEIAQRTFSAHPTEGLLPVHDRLSGPGGVDWMHDSDEVDIDDLRQLFEYDCFDYEYPHTALDGDQTGSRLHVDGDAPPDADDGYALPVSGSRIPLPYVWAAADRLTVDRVRDALLESDTEVAPSAVAEAFGYRFRDVDGDDIRALKHQMRAGLDPEKSADIGALNRADKRDDPHRIVAEALPAIRDWLTDERGCELDPITVSDIRALGKQFAGAIADVEAALAEMASYDIEKEPISLGFTTPDDHEPSLATALDDFLRMEYAATRADNHGYYWRTPVQRLRTGKSMLVEVTDVEERGPVLEVEACLPYEEVARFDNPEYVLNKLRHKESDGTTSGSWLVANPVSQHNGVLPEPHNPSANTDRDDARRARYIERGPLVSIADLDVEAGRVRFAAHKWASGGGEFGVSHRTPVGPDEGPGEWDVPFEPGDWFILDPNHDDVTSRREAAMLDDRDNDLCSLLTSAIRGASPEFTTDAFDSDAVDDFVDFLRAQHEAPVTPDPPNGAQSEFIRETERRLSLLQGPPGTGKTQTLGAALVARANAAGVVGDSLVAGVVGPSNKAVDVAVESTAEAVAYTEAAAPDGTVDAADVTDVLLVRVVSSSYAADDDENLPIIYMTPDFEVVDHGPLPNTVPDDSLGEEIRRRLSEPMSTEHVAVFGTSAGLQRLLAGLTPDDPLDQSVFNLVAADEASMLRLPGLLVPGGCLQDEAQVLVSGDQRQMPPVITHEWDAETRRSARELLPQLPSLDYLRLLGGHGVESGEFEGFEIDDLALEPGLDISMTQLDVSYRCAPPCTALLNRGVYEKKDGINYRTADEADEIDADDPPLANPEDAPLDREAAEAILDPDKPVVLVRHDEDGSRQLNELESSITTALADCLNGGEDGYGMGVVTPHNSQRSRLQMATRDRDWITADTVERFQGDEEDVVVMSGTESDPDYLTSQSEFILDQNRITVALSRMKHKLVIVASEEIFGLIPRDTDEYEDAELWKGIHAALAGGEDAAWEGTAEELLGDDLPEDAGGTSVSVFTTGSPDAFRR